MKRLNFIGLTMVKLRYKRGWTQNDLLTKLDLEDYPITRQTLANMEIGRAPVGDLLLPFLAKVFCVRVEELFPEDLRDGSQLKRLAKQCVIRPLRRSRYEDADAAE